MSRSRKLPGYATNLMDHHRAFSAELESIVAGIPLEPGQWVLDVASGDGVYSHWLAGRGGRVVGVDLSAAFMGVARGQLEEDVNAGRVQLVMADVKRLPFGENRFDLAWCAQSLYSLPSPVEAVKAMARVVRPGGCVAVLENDEFHHVLLPWPVEVELALRHAELLANIKKSEKPRKFYIGRQLRKVFRAAGLREFRQVSHTIDRQNPLEDCDRYYFASYLEDLWKDVEEHLEPDVLHKFEALVDPGSAGYLLDDPDFTATCVNHVAWAVKPVGDLAGRESSN